MSDGIADNFEVQVGSALVTADREQITAEASGRDGASTITFTDPLLSDLEISTLINATAGAGGLYSNASISVDYVSPTNFKFARESVGAGKRVIGHRNKSGLVTDALATTTISAATQYNLRLTIQNDKEVTLYANGAAQVNRVFSELLKDGPAYFYILGHEDRDARPRRT